MQNQEFYIYDKDLNAVETGKIGELYIGGAGVAKGYWQEDVLTAKKFITHPVSREYLYKTGDLGRYLPDGNIEFLGRVDYQVKIGGYRIDITGLENVLCSHPAVKQAIVAPVRQNNRYTNLQAYIITKELESQISCNLQNLVTEHVGIWHDIYKLVNQENISSHDSKLFNTAGWIDSYKGERFSNNEMEEWVGNTANRVLSFRPKKVLEIGCGLGLLLFRLAPYCQKYVGTDFSESALDFIDKYSALVTDNVITLLCREAINFQGIPKEFDTIVINSVIQYFPHIDYLTKVLEQAVELIVDTGQIFIGDIRNLNNVKQFYKSFMSYQNPELTGEELLQLHIEDKFNREKELLVDPQYFYYLAKKINRISSVDVLLKEGSYCNEMNCFRYDVILHINKKVLFVEGEQINWDMLSYNKTREILKRSQPNALKIINIPNKRLHNVLHIQNNKAVDPSVFFRLAKKMKYCVEICWSPKDDKKMDVFFYKKVFAGQAIKYQVSANDEIDSCEVAKEMMHYGNLPIQAVYVRKVEEQLNQFLKNNFPNYTSMSSFFFVNAMPLTDNKKIDRSVFYNACRVSNKQYIAPKTTTEKLLVKIWRKFFNMKKISVESDFNDLGVGSLVVIRIIHQIEKTFGIILSLEESYQFPAIQTVKKRYTFPLPKMARGKRSKFPPLSHLFPKKI